MSAMLALLFGGEKFNAVWSCSCCTVTLFVQSGRIRASTQGEVEQIKIVYVQSCSAQSCLYSFGCCLCPLRELELFHKETV